MNIEIRDLRRKQFFQVDDEYLNGYARLCGINATGVYMSLCRHANKKQECWPSKKTIAEELAIGERSVFRALKELEKWGIITQSRLPEWQSVRDSNGKYKPTVYILVDKSNWKAKPSATVAERPSATQAGDRLPNGTFSRLPHRHTKDTHNNVEGIYTYEGMSPEATDLQKFNPKIQKLLDDEERHIQIIGLWICEMKFYPENEEQIESIKSRNFKAAKLLIGYSNNDIISTIETLKNTEYLTNFSLETVTKYIDKTVKARIEHKKIVRFEEVGNNTVRAIYE